jgi:hypothetical protein
VKARWPLRERLVALAQERRRFGSHRLLIFLRREGFEVNHKRLFRVYREERLMVRKRGGRKRTLGCRTPIPVPTLSNELWVLDFVADQLVAEGLSQNFTFRPPSGSAPGWRCSAPSAGCPPPKGSAGHC